MNAREALAVLERALARAVAKHSTFPDDPHHQLALAAEELGEAARALNDGRAEFQRRYRAGESDPSDEEHDVAGPYRDQFLLEVADVGAVVLRILMGPQP